MLDRHARVAIYMEGASNQDWGKMGFGVLRFSPNPIVCVIDSQAEFKDMSETGRSERPVPIVPSVADAIKMGAQVMILGIAPGGGVIPDDWWPDIDLAIEGKLSIVNGLHDLVGPRYSQLGEGQFVWDVRVEPTGLEVGQGKAWHLPMRRVLMIGTDMAVGKMTAGLEFLRAARHAGIPTEFVATGQIGITVTGAGVPLDAVRIDFASGAVERCVLEAAEELEQNPKGLIVIEGQGALIHPGSSANLPLIRGSCPTHLILCHRAGQKHLRQIPEVVIPPLREYANLYEDLTEARGAFARPTTLGIALNTSDLDDEEAQKACLRTEDETGLPCTDPVRHGASKLVEALSRA